MTTFDLERADIYKAVMFYRIFPAGILKFFRISLFCLGLVPVIVFAVSKIYDLQFAVNIGWSLILLPLALSICFFELFANYYLKYPEIKNADNIAELLDFEAARVFDRAFELSSNRGEELLSAGSLLAAIIKDDTTEKLFISIMPDFGAVKNQLKKDFRGSRSFLNWFSLSAGRDVSLDIKKTLDESLVIRDKHAGQKISILDITAALFDYNEEFRQFILGQDLDKDDLEELAGWYEHIWSFGRELNKFWSMENLLRQPPIGRDWIYGHAPYLTSFAVNISDRIKFDRPKMRLVARKNEIEQIEQILARSGENNVLIVGEEGVGKESVVMDFSELIAKGRALPQLNYKKVFDLNLALIAGASKSVTDVQNILLHILNEASRAGNIILILKDFHNFIGEIGGLGRIDVSEIMIPYLKSSNVQVIATTNPHDFHRYIESRPEIASVFERINLSEPNSQQTLRMLEETIGAIEARHGALVTYGAIKEIIDGADKFIRTSPFPEKAFELLSEVVSYAVANKERIIVKRHVDEVISRKTGVPLGPIAGEEKEKLEKLEDLMHKEIVGQNRAVEVVAATMRRLRTGLAKRGKPAGVFLFVGPTGVGKTLTAKILAKSYFGSSDRMLRFDMSEYQDVESMSRFIGSTITNEPGQFITKAADNPFSLILLDEIEKANQNILNIFLQVFDEGRLTDAFGRIINFEQNIIIATSNAAAGFIRDLVKEGLDPSLEKERVINAMIEGRYFSPELLNRFDEVVIFHPLSEEQVGKITELLLKALSFRLKEQGYSFQPTQDLADYVSRVGFDPQFGARPMERVIRDKVENAVARKILDGTIKKGVEFTLSPDDLK